MFPLSCTMMSLVKVCLVIVFFLSPTAAYIEGLYCGKENCYDVLGITRDATKQQLSRAYRKLARQYHPDMQDTKEEQEEAVIKFQKVVTAYEILKDDESREDYHYMLDNPEDYYSHYYYYYRRRVVPQVDVRVVIFVFVTILTVIQFWSQHSNYNMAISELIKVPKYRIKAQGLAKEQGLLDGRKKKDRNKTKEQIRWEEEEVLKKILKEKMDIRGGYKKPSWQDLLVVQLFKLPYHVVMYIVWYVTWIYRFNIKKEKYGHEDKCYLIRKHMKMSQGQWDSLDDNQIGDFLQQELWIPEKFKAWKDEQDQHLREEMASNARYKSYRRYMRKGGPGQMTFGPE